MSAPLRAFRVGVVGARRVRQGTGPYLAKFLHAAGTKVVAVCGTSAATAAAAAADLRERHGIEAAPYDDAEALVRGARPDALVVASPAETHLALLDLARREGLHALCEKPLVLHDGDFAADARRLVAEFSAARLHLAVAAQWRHALGTYLRLFPAVSPRAASTFEMRLSPVGTGASMLPDALPHALALLDHLFPAEGAPLRDVSFPARGDADVEVRFTHSGGRAGIACRVRLVSCPSPPRPLAFGFDGHVAHRVIREPGYRFALKAGTEEGAPEVDLPDPLEACVREFVARVRRGPPFPPDPTIAAGAAGLQAIVRAWRDGARAGGGGKGA